MAVHNQTANLVASATLSALKTASGNSSARLYQYRLGGTEILNIPNSYSGLSTSVGKILPLNGLYIGPVRLRSSVVAQDFSVTSGGASCSVNIWTDGTLRTVGDPGYT